MTGGPSTVRGVTLNWSVANGAAPRTRNVAVSATYSTIRGVKTIALNTQVGCY